MNATAAAASSERPSKRKTSANVDGLSSKRQKGRDGKCPDISIVKLRSNSFTTPSFRGPTVQVTVGKDAKSMHTFTVLKELLTTDSPFFRNVFRHEFKEGRAGTVTLPDHHPANFDIYLRFIHYGQIVMADKTQGRENQAESDFEIRRKRFNEEYSAYGDALSLADYLQSDAFHNAVTSAFIDECVYVNKCLGKPAEILHVMKTGVPEFIKLARDFVVYWGGAHWRDLPELEDVEPEITSKFYKNALVDTFILLSGEGRGKSEDYPWVADPCQYHRHRDTKKVGTDGVTAEKIDH
ncbi:hypothetical protein BT63DRAFT_426841 [Microthyrium microscopicum]|uniref:BTB domain-containing protein n=1 Tax=Microthyrium microscopicum TaxID=703497 RepID=A0A6A6UA44_9PEZI|nr:hypothetical protein BT63DRAFT_426841 [Microthyrium microscopicum]